MSSNTFAGDVLRSTIVGGAILGETDRRKEEKRQKQLLASAPTAESLEADSRKEARRKRRLLQSQQVQTQLTGGQGLAGAQGRQTLGGQ